MKNILKFIIPFTLLAGLSHAQGTFNSLQVFQTVTLPNGSTLTAGGPYAIASGYWEFTQTGSNAFVVQGGALFNGVQGVTSTYGFTLAANAHLVQIIPASHPTVAVGPGLGSGAIATLLNASDTCGTLRIITGTGNTNNTLVTVTLVNTLTNGALVLLQPIGKASTLTGIYADAVSSTQWSLYPYSTPLPDGVTLYWNYFIIDAVTY